MACGVLWARTCLGVSCSSLMWMQMITGSVNTAVISKYTESSLILRRGQAHVLTWSFVLAPFLVENKCLGRKGSERERRAGSEELGKMGKDQNHMFACLGPRLKPPRPCHGDPSWVSHGGWRVAGAGTFLLPHFACLLSRAHSSSSHIINSLRRHHKPQATPHAQATRGHQTSLAWRPRRPHRARQGAAAAADKEVCFVP